MGSDLTVLLIRTAADIFGLPRMVTMDPTTKKMLGFLTVVRDPEYGLCGGYLILNSAGRPVEFHCTTPLKPNRPQEILYGPTLESFLYGEQIGQTLIQQGGESPLVVFTDLEPVLTAREFVPMPLALVLPDEPEGGDKGLEGAAGTLRVSPAADCTRSVPDTSSPSSSAFPSDRRFRLDAPHGGPRLLTFELGRNRVAVPERLQQDRELTVERLCGLVDLFDLAEPFGRIRDAIEEARQAAR
jgi:hypothetical protein